jgi:hypothetical protein
MKGQLRLLLVVGAALAAVVLFLVLRPGGGGGDSTTTTGPPTTAPGATTTAPAAPARTAIRITIEGGKPVGGIKHATLKQGTKAVLVVDSDVADEVHLHGYDLHVDVPAGGVARLPFTASIAGRFEAELESRKLPILDLEVVP